MRVEIHRRLLLLYAILRYSTLYHHIHAPTHLCPYAPTAPIAACASLRLRPSQIRAACVPFARPDPQSAQIRLRTWYGIEAARAVTAAPVRS